MTLFPRIYLNVVTLLALCTACLPARAIDVYTHSVGEQVDVVGNGLRGKPHAGRRAYQVELVRASSGLI